MIKNAVKEERQWVRLTKVCNNHCIFCLDSDAQNGSFLPFEIIKEKIKDGIKRGKTRLILSGGEPTIHPQFFEILSFAKNSNYQWIQIITNGRMFSYFSFAKRAIELGVDEVTFSIHGHNEELHDKLTSCKGSFTEAIRGLENILKIGGVVISVDIVMNSLNISYLPQIIEFFINKGVREFDLLYIVPFGKAWDENRKLVFFEHLKAKKYLKKTFELRKKYNIKLWTNRMPPSYLEGYEDLIQSPHKLYDEVLGERDIFKKFVDFGTPFQCKGERCNYCFINNFCREFEKTREILFNKEIKRILINSDDNINKNILKKIIEKNPIRSIEIYCGDFNKLNEIVPLLKEKEMKLILIAGEKLKIGKINISDFNEIIFENIEMMEQVDTKNIKTGIILNKKNGRIIIRKNNNRIFRIILPFFEDIEDVRKNYPEKKDLMAILKKYRTFFENIPVCLYGQRHSSAPALYPFSFSILDSKGKISIPDFVHFYIKNLCFSKSLRCNGCKFFNNCKGFHINAIRFYGFSILTPFKD